MTSEFVNHFTESLVPQIADHPQSADQDGLRRHHEHNLTDILPLLATPIQHQQLLHAIDLYTHLPSSISTATNGSEDQSLQTAVHRKIVVALYAEALSLFLSEAMEAETEAEWWADIERS